MFPHTAISAKPGAGIYTQATTLGNFYLILSLEGPPEEVNLELGHNTLTKIEELISQTPQISPQELVEIQKEQFANGITLNILVAKIEGQKLSLAGMGNVAARLLRQNKVITLLAPRPSPLAPINISGPLFHNDFLILATQDFFQAASLQDLQNLATKTPDEAKDDLSKLVETAPENNHLAVCLIQIDLTASKSADTVTPPQLTPSLNPSINSTPTFWQKISSGRKKLYLRGQNGENIIPPQNKKILYLSLIIFVTMISLITYQLRSRTLEIKNQKLSAVERQINDGITSAQKLEGLNDQIARLTLLQTQTDVNQLINSGFGEGWQTQKSPETQKLTALISKLDAEIAKTAHIFKIASLDNFYDFSLLKANPQIVTAALHNGTILALDSGNGAIYSLATKNKAASIVTGANELKSAKFIDFAGDNAYIWTTGGIFNKNLSTDAALKPVIKPSDKWKEILAMGFFGGNIYLLDPPNNQIWKYQGTDLGFADIGSYLKPGLTLDLSKANNMTIDGYIYTLSDSGSITRFASGAPDNFALSGLPDTLGKTTMMYTTDETKNIYLWDETRKRVVVFDKKGVYQSQYILAASPSPLAPILLADESAGKIFLISGAKVYSVEMK